MEDGLEPNLRADIYKAEQIITRLEKDIRKLWKYVIVPYKQDICRSQILDKLNETDYIKFYEFMIQKNETYIKAKKFLDYLNGL